MKIHLCLLGKKGFYFFLGFVNNPDFFDIEISVEVGRDQSILNDYAEEIFLLAKEKAIFSEERSVGFDYSNYDFVFAVGWRWLINGCPIDQLIVVHDSLLPRYRGFSPLVNALMNKERYVGVTALFGSDEYDKGPIIVQIRTEISYPIRISDAIDQISKLYAQVASTLLGHIKKGTILSTPQNEIDATYSCWLDDDDYYINWNESAKNIVHKICLLGFPYSHAKSYLNGELVYILDAELIEGISLEKVDLGKVIMVDNGCPLVIANDGLVKLKKILDVNSLDILPIKKFRSRFSNDSI